eukprot:Gb_07190 [translate_table: standard]
METVCLQWKWQWRFKKPAQSKFLKWDCKSQSRFHLNLRCFALSKPAERMVSALRRSRGDEPAVRGLLRKSATLSKAVRLSALDDLLRQEDWDLALPMYRMIREADWYKWNAKLHAQLIALLEKFEQQDEAQSLSLEAKQNLSSVDKLRFYCALIEHYSKCGLKDQILSTYNLLKQLPHKSVDVIGYKSLISALAVLNLPREAEEILREMEDAGYKPSPNEFKGVLFAYGRCGHFQEMENILKLMENHGHSADTVTINMILSCYGSYREYTSIKIWLRRMHIGNIDLSIRTYNAIANACPTLISFALLREDIPLSVGSLLDVLEKRINATKELSVVSELLGLGLLPGITDWSSLQWTLDLHGMVPSAAYAMLLVWLEEVKTRLESESKLPSEISVVCGLGKHSMARGDSPIKIMVSDMMFKLKSPLKADRYNRGRFVARGNTVKAWLS